VGLFQPRQPNQRLQRFAQAHVVGQTAAKAEFLQEFEPAQPLFLITAQLPLKSRRFLDRLDADAAAQQGSASANGTTPAAQAVHSSKADTSKSPGKGLADISGPWKATVTYDWPGAVYEERFNFEVDGTELSGTASFLTVDRGIFDGKIEGNRVSFVTKTIATMDDKTSQDVHSYKGTVEGNTIQFSMLTDSSVESHVPVHFTAKR